MGREGKGGDFRIAAIGASRGRGRLRSPPLQGATVEIVPEMQGTTQEMASEGARDPSSFVKKGVSIA